MMLAGLPPRTTRAAYTTPELLEAMAERSGRPIELARDAAYLTVGGTTWVAPLEPVTT